MTFPSHDQGGPTPPAHWGCRSVIVPVVKPEYAVFGKEDRERPAVGADGVENVKGTRNYESWLKKQPASFQDDVLGAEKGKLFRQGGLSLDRFVDSNYRPLTLSELRAREPAAFKRANINDGQ